MPQSCRRGLRADRRRDILGRKIPGDVIHELMLPPRAARFQLSGSSKESLGLLLALVIPIVIMGLLIWLLGRSAQPAAGGGFAEWPGGGVAS